MDTIDLSRFDSSNKSATLNGSIADSKSNKLTLENLSQKINFNNEFYCYDENVLYSYKNYLSQFTVWNTLPVKYHYKPELLAKDLYGSVDLWYLIMWFNDIPSAMDFNTEKIKVFDPKYMNIINKIIENNRRNIIKNNQNPPLVENLTLKPILIKDSRIS